MVALVLLGAVVFKSRFSASDSVSGVPVADIFNAPSPVLQAPNSASRLPAQVLAGIHAHSQDLVKLRVLNEILKSKNDNDPRIDTELKVLTAGSKELFVDSYKQLAPEARNERGTVVFLIGRNLSSSTDVNFLNQVLHEAPCLSMNDCNEAPPPSKLDESHFESANEVSLSYPQLVALKSIENFLSSDPNPAHSQLRRELVHVLLQAKDSAVPRVSQQANEILKQLKF